VADDPPFDHIDHVFGDVGSVVADPLQMTGNTQQMDQDVDL
jgi:hypothetical protein